MLLQAKTKAYFKKHQEAISQAKQQLLLASQQEAIPSKASTSNHPALRKAEISQNAPPPSLVVLNPYYVGGYVASQHIDLRSPKTTTHQESSMHVKRQSVKLPHGGASLIPNT
jgi:hypothetical protein